MILVRMESSHSQLFIHTMADFWRALNNEILSICVWKKHLILPQFAGADRKPVKILPQLRDFCSVITLCYCYENPLRKSVPDCGREFRLPIWFFFHLWYKHKIFWIRSSICVIFRSRIWGSPSDILIFSKIKGSPNVQPVRNAHVIRENVLFENFRKKSKSPIYQKRTQLQKENEIFIFQTKCILIENQKVFISSYLGSFRKRSYHTWKSENFSSSSVVRSFFKAS